VDSQDGCPWDSNNPRQTKTKNAAMALPVETLCMGCADEKCDFKPMAMQRRPLGDSDVLIDMKYCGICHTDLHTAAGHLKALGMKQYPCVPGHELSGVCTAVGAKVTRVKVGDQVGVGCMVDSCLNCSACKRGEEQKCLKQVGTYNAKDNGSGRAATYPAGGHTLGGVFVCSRKPARTRPSLPCASAKRTFRRVARCSSSCTRLAASFAAAALSLAQVTPRKWWSTSVLPSSSPRSTRSKWLDRCVCVCLCVCVYICRYVCACVQEVHIGQRRRCG
jgi:hypothetical protein